MQPFAELAGEGAVFAVAVDQPRPVGAAHSLFTHGPQAAVAVGFFCQQLADQGDAVTFAGRVEQQAGVGEV